MATRMLITYRAGSKVSTAAIAAVRGQVVKQFTLAPIVVADLDDDAIKALRADPSVLAVEKDGTVSILKTSTKPKKAKPKASKPDDTKPTVAPLLRAPWGIVKTRASEVHAKGITGVGVKVAVIDTGIDFTHPDLAAIYKGGVNFVTPANPPMDDNSHGTHCAGTLAAILDGQGIFGMAPGVDLYAVKVLSASGSGSWSAIISAYDWCVQNGIKLTSNSYGGSAGSVAVETALNAAVDAGVLMIFSAGNSGAGTGGTTVGFPARYAKAIAVSATDENDVIASFSSRGPEVAVAAPGVGVESCVLNGLYGLKSGTSMACPHVAGACALALSKGFTVAQVRQRLTTMLPDKGVPGRDPLYGWGLLDAYALVFGLDPTVPVFTSPITLDGSGSFDPDGSITEWVYTMSDGRTLTGKTHTVTMTPGPHSITLTVKDNQGATGATTRSLMIENAAPPPNQAPVAVFTINGT
jgi:subtilisin